MRRKVWRQRTFLF